MNIKNYTHKGIKIKDIRLKNNIENNDKYLALILDDDSIKDTLYINYNILNDRVKSYFLGNGLDKINKNILLSLRWNFIINKGFYYKISGKCSFDKYVSKNPSKFYISIIEIEGSEDYGSGLGDFDKVFGEYITI